MAKQRRKSTFRDPKSGTFVVDRAAFGKISAVEGIRIAQVMEKRAIKADQKGLTAEEHRRTIIRSYRQS